VLRKVFCKADLLVGVLLLLILAGCCNIFSNIDVVRTQVHYYTNVTIKAGHFLVSEGTRGALLVGYAGTVTTGMGGSEEYPLDDTARMGSFAPTLEAHAEAFDRIFLAVYYPGYLLFDLGSLCTSVYIALSQDHGPYPEEALEYRLEISADGQTFYPVPSDVPITLYRRGWSARGEDILTCQVLAGSEPANEPGGSGPWPDTLNDDWAAQWDLPFPARFLKIMPLQAEPPYNEPEVDAVKGLNCLTTPQAFTPGDTAKVVDGTDLAVELRAQPGGAAIDRLPRGYVLKIKAGPQFTIEASGAVRCWWKVQKAEFDSSGTEGWVPQDFIYKVLSEDLVPAQVPGYFTLAQERIEEAINWANNNEEEVGYCLRFVSKAFGLGTNINSITTRWESPEDAIQKLGDNFYPSDKCWNPPRGALVFFSALEEYAPYGHIGISLGNGDVIHLYDRVRTEKIADIEKLSLIGSYLGWAFPPQEWLTQ